MNTQSVTDGVKRASRSRQMIHENKEMWSMAYWTHWHWIYVQLWQPDTGSKKLFLFHKYKKGRREASTGLMGIKSLSARQLNTPQSFTHPISVMAPLSQLQQPGSNRADTEPTQSRHRADTEPTRVRERPGLSHEVSWIKAFLSVCGLFFVFFFLE